MHNTVFSFIKMKVYNNDICSIYNNDFTTKNYILMSWSAASCLYQVGAVFANRRIRLWKKKGKINIPISGMPTPKIKFQGHFTNKN